MIFSCIIGSLVIFTVENVLASILALRSGENRYCPIFYPTCEETEACGPR